MNISSVLTFNFSSSFYDLLDNSYSYRIIYTSHSTVSSLFINSAYLMMQNDFTLAITIYSLNFSTISTLYGLPLKKIYSFFNYTSSGGGSNQELYVLQETSVTEVLYSYLNGFLTVGANIIELPSNQYEPIIGKDIQSLYVYGSNFIYANGTGSFATMFNANPNTTTNTSNTITPNSIIDPTASPNNTTNAIDPFNNSTFTNDSTTSLVCQAINC